MTGATDSTRRSIRGVMLGFSFLSAALFGMQTMGINRVLHSSFLSETFEPIDCLQQSNPDSVGQSASQTKPTRRLEFVHIPKTGGTVIESEAAKENITWSICHFGIHQNIVRMSLNETICPEGSLKYNWPKRKKYHSCPWWHLPAQYFELQDVNPYEGADLFCVVRNPYERLLSEYYYMGTYIKFLSEEEVNDVLALNVWVKRIIELLVVQSKPGDIDRNRTGNAPYFYNAGHFIPQYDFVFEHRRRVIKHVLRFENLNEEFHELMKLYDLPVRLPQRRVRESHTKKLSIFNLTKENLELIERLYDADFREWGYDMMSEIIPEETLTRNEDLLRQAIAKRNRQRPTKKIGAKNKTKVTE
jgi:Sulfotransferase family